VGFDKEGKIFYEIPGKNPLAGGSTGKADILQLKNR
jgi:hypothetical protein